MYSAFCILSFAKCYTRKGDKNGTLQAIAFFSLCITVSTSTTDCHRKFMKIAAFNYIIFALLSRIAGEKISVCPFVFFFKQTI